MPDSAPLQPILQRDHKTMRGVIAYTSDKPDRKGQERGREYFHIDLHGDGRRSITAHCEIDDRPSVMRDITYSVGADWKPLDCFVRLSVADKFVGSGWFHFTDRVAQCEAFTEADGRIAQSMDLAGPLITFQNHAIACDAWHLAHLSLDKGAETQSLAPVLLSSPDHRGATGPMLFKIGVHIQFHGRERVTVPAGSFDALHFVFVSAPGLPQEHPHYHVWCTDDGHFTFLRGNVEGYMLTRYELVELSGGL